MRAVVIGLALSASAGVAHAAGAVLIVTWLTNPPHSYQTNFSTLKACEAARTKVLAERQRMAEENAKPVQMGGGTLYRPPPPQVSAICTPR